MNKFITFEGCDGVGKSTHSKFLQAYLEEHGIPYVKTREPGGTSVADKIREVILDKDNDMSTLCEAHLFAAARAEHIDNVILPALAEGKTVICDRYVDSSFAYQGFARGMGLDRVMEINRYAVEHCMPEITVFIDLAPEQNWRKKKGQTVDDRMEAQGMDFQKKVYEGFKALAALYPERFIPIVPCENKEDTFALILDVLKSRGLLS